MKVTIHIQDNRSAEFVSLLQNFLATPAETVQQPATTPEPKKKAKAAEPAQVAIETAAELGSEITLEELRKVVVTKTNEGHSDAMKEILKQMGAATVPALKPHQRNEFLLRINAL